MKEPRTSFSWHNYTKPTPQNLLGLSAAVRRLVAAAAVTSILSDANDWLSFTIVMTGAALDELKNFFANVVEETEEAVAAFPSGEHVVVTKEVPKEEPPQ